MVNGLKERRMEPRNSVSLIYFLNFSYCLSLYDSRNLILLKKKSLNKVRRSGERDDLRLDLKAQLSEYSLEKKKKQ